MATVSLDEPTFDNVYAPVLRYDGKPRNEKNMNMALRFASPDAAMKPWSEHSAWVQRQEKYVQLTMAASERTDNLDPESKRRLEKRIEYLKRMSHGSLDDETRKAYLDTRKEINDLCEEMNRHIRLYDGGHLSFEDGELTDLEQDM